MRQFIFYSLIIQTKISTNNIKDLIFIFITKRNNNKKKKKVIKKKN